MKAVVAVIILFFILPAGVLYADSNYLIPTGHSTVFIRLDGQNIITDPNWNERNLFLPRLVPPPFPLADLPPVDLVLISHGHFDHLDLGTLEGIHKMNKSVKIFLPEKLGYVLKRTGITNYRECVPGENILFGNLLVKTYKARHDGRRFLVDNTSLSLMYLVKGSRTVFFTGDTGYTNLFNDIGRSERIHAALIMIGAWDHMPQPVRSRHLQSDEAVRVFQDLRADFMIPVHYDTFSLGVSGPLTPVELLLKTARSNRVEQRIRIEKFGTKILLK